MPTIVKVGTSTIEHVHGASVRTGEAIATDPRLAPLYKREQRLLGVIDHPLRSWMTVLPVIALYTRHLMKTGALWLFLLTCAAL